MVVPGTKTKQTRTGVFLALLFVLLLAFGMGADAREKADVFDNAGLFSAYERSSIRELAKELSDEYEINVVVLTADDTYGNSSRDYMEDFYEEEGYIDNGARGGIVFIIDMDNRELNLVTSGDAIYYITDEREESIYDAGISYASVGDYGNAMYAMLQSAQQYFERGIPDRQYVYDEETGRVVRHRAVSAGEAVISAALAALAAFICCFTVYRGYGTIKPYEYSLDGNADFRLNGRVDTLVNQFETVRRIQEPRPPGGGGRSSGGSHPGRTTVHHSSGGHSYGGGHGRKF